ncbi:MAG: hypothetical protein ACR2NR_15405 [Solirubrobacteraceae bacterium]
MRRVQVLLIAGLTCILVAAASAYGKGDVRATLENPAQLQRASPGERVRMAWTLSEAPQLPSLRTPGGVAPRPFGASGVYVRVRGAAGATPKIFAATSASDARPQSGRYVADLTVPAGGITAIAIGLKGFRGLPGQTSTRADIFFSIANDPFTVAKAPVTVAKAPVTATSSDTGASVPWIPLAAGFALLGVLLAGYRAVTARRPVT